MQQLECLVGVVAPCERDRPVRVDDVAFALGRPVREVDALLKFAEQPTSLDAPMDRGVAAASEDTPVTLPVVGEIGAGQNLVGRGVGNAGP